MRNKHDDIWGECMKNKVNCTDCTEGKIAQLVIKGQDFPTVVVVHYEVDGTVYELRESMKLKSEKIKFGFLTIGQKRVPVLGNTSVGSKVRVLYDPRNPADAYMPDNTGKINV